MTPQGSKRKGRDGENAIVAWLQTRGWPHAERRRLTGALDRGDVTGIPGVTIEAKAEARVDLAGWVRELQVEMANNGDHVGAVIAKRRGHRDPSDWYAVMPASIFATLLKEAGY